MKCITINHCIDLNNCYSYIISDKININCFLEDKCLTTNECTTKQNSHKHKMRIKGIVFQIPGIIYLLFIGDSFKRAKIIAEKKLAT